MQFLLIMVIMAGVFWRSLAKTTPRAIALAVGIPISINLLALTFCYLSTGVENFKFFFTVIAILILYLILVSGVWLMLFLGRFRIINLIPFLFFLFLFFLTKSWQSTILITLSVIVFLYLEKDNIEIFSAGFLDRLSIKNRIIEKWSLFQQKSAKKYDILILTTSAGSGHMVAARNIAIELEKNYPQKKILCLNVFDYIGKNFRFLQEAAWEYLQVDLPSFYRPIHRLAIWNFRRLIAKKSLFGAEVISKTLITSPKVIIATHPLAVSIGSALKEKLGGKLIVVPTDFYIHGHYTAPNADLYCLPSENCLFAGVKKDQILPKSIITGIPISTIYSSLLNKSQAREKLGIPEGKTVVMVNFGGAGIARSKVVIELVSLVLFSVNNFHFLLSVGTNELLKALFQDPEIPCTIIENNDLPLALTAADVMIGKVGGVSVAEALACGTKVGIWAKGGPEDFNAKFLIRNGLGKKIGGFLELLTDFKRTKKWIESVKESSKTHGFPQSSLRVVEGIMSLIPD